MNYRILPLLVATAVLAIGETRTGKSFYTLCPAGPAQHKCVLQEAATNPALAQPRFGAKSPDSPGPFQQTIDLKVFDGSNAVVGRIDIPDGLSVQIESISAYANVPAGQNPRVSISTTVRGADGTYFLPLSKQDSADRQDWLVSTQPLRLYGDYPSIFLLLTRPQATGDLTLTISVSGTITYAQ